ncbi:hypothetical protein [Mycoplasma hafezii]|uniref:hypothetical protein n=1 Tax=Mycoplasma hafezii TaxID=525886 RepID=UPI003CF48D27
MILAEKINQLTNLTEEDRTEALAILKNMSLKKDYEKQQNYNFPLVNPDKSSPDKYIKYDSLADEVYWKKAVKVDAKNKVNNSKDLTQPEKTVLNAQIDEIIDGDRDLREDKINKLISKVDNIKTIYDKKYLNKAQKGALKDELINAEADKVAEILQKATDLDTAMKNLDDYISKYKVTKETKPEDIKNKVNHSQADSKYDEADSELQKIFDNLVDQAINLSTNENKEQVEQRLNEIKKAYNDLNGDAKLEKAKKDVKDKFNKEWQYLKANQKAKLLNDIDSATKISNITSLVSTGDTLNESMSKLSAKDTNSKAIHDLYKYAYSDADKQTTFDTVLNDITKFKDDTTTEVTDLAKENAKVNKYVSDYDTHFNALNGSIENAKAEFNNFDTLSDPKKTELLNKVINSKAEEHKKSFLDPIITEAFEQTKNDAQAKVDNLSALTDDVKTQFKNKIKDTQIIKQTRNDDQIFALANADKTLIPYDQNVKILLIEAIKDNAIKQIDDLNNLTKDEKKEITDKVNDLDKNNPSVPNVSDEADKLYDKAYFINQIKGLSSLNKKQQNHFIKQIKDTNEDTQIELHAALDKILNNAISLNSSMGSLNTYLNKYKSDQNTPADKIKNGVNHSVADQKYDDADSDKQTAFDNKAKEGLDLINFENGENKNETEVDKLLEQIKTKYSELNGDTKLANKKAELIKNANATNDAPHAWHNLKTNQKNKLIADINQAKTLAELDKLETTGQTLDDKMLVINNLLTNDASTKKSLKYNYADTTKQTTYDQESSSAHTFKENNDPIAVLADELTKVTKLENSFSKANTELNGTVEQAKAEFDNFIKFANADKTKYQNEITHQTSKSDLDAKIIDAFNKVKEAITEKIESLGLKLNSLESYKQQLNTAEIIKQQRQDQKIFTKLDESNNKIPYDSQLASILNDAQNEKTKDSAKTEIDNLTNLTEDEKNNIKKEIDSIKPGEDNQTVQDKVNDILAKAKAKDKIAGKPYLNNNQKMH